MLIVDGNNIMHRAVEEVGLGVHPIRGLYNRFVAECLKQPVIIVWDGPFGNQERRKQFPDYKKNRKPKEESKLQLFDVAKGVLSLTSCIQVEVPGWEADDVVATLIHRYHKDHDLTVDSNDGDYWQHNRLCKLPRVSKVWSSFSADQCILYKATVGDRKDNVPGLKGFGQKTWDLLAPNARNRLILAIKLDDYQRWNNVALDTLPKRFHNKPELFEELKLYWSVKHWMPVPHDLIDKHTKVGTPNMAAAEIFLGNFMI